MDKENPRVFFLLNHPVTSDDFILEQARMLQENGYRCFFWTGKDHHETAIRFPEIESGLKVYGKPFSTKRYSRIRYLRAALKILPGLRTADILYVRHAALLPLARQLKQLRGCRVVYERDLLTELDNRQQEYLLRQEPKKSARLAAFTREYTRCLPLCEVILSPVENRETTIAASCRRLWGTSRLVPQSYFSDLPSTPQSLRQEFKIPDNNSILLYYVSSHEGIQVWQFVEKIFNKLQNCYLVLAFETYDPQMQKLAANISRIPNLRNKVFLQFPPEEEHLFRNPTDADLVISRLTRKLDESSYICLLAPILNHFQIRSPIDQIHLLHETGQYKHFTGILNNDRSKESADKIQHLLENCDDHRVQLLMNGFPVDSFTYDFLEVFRSVERMPK